MQLVSSRAQDRELGFARRDASAKEHARQALKESTAVNARATRLLILERWIRQRPLAWIPRFFLSCALP